MSAPSPPLLMLPRFSPHLRPTITHVNPSSKESTLPFLPNCDDLNRIHLPSLLKSCARHRHVSLGRQIHALSIKLGSLTSDPLVQSSLVSFYASCSLHALALQLFDELPQPNLFSYTSAMEVCVKSDQPERAVSLFHQMLMSGMCFYTESLQNFTRAEICASLHKLNPEPYPA